VERAKAGKFVPIAADTDVWLFGWVPPAVSRPGYRRERF
jgi:hypothetical protein